MDLDYDNPILLLEHTIGREHYDHGQIELAQVAQDTQSATKKQGNYVAGVDGQTKSKILLTLAIASQSGAVAELNLYNPVRLGTQCQREGRI